MLPAGGAPSQSLGVLVSKTQQGQNTQVYIFFSSPLLFSFPLPSFLPPSLLLLSFLSVLSPSLPLFFQSKDPRLWSQTALHSSQAQALVSYLLSFLEL